MSRLDKQMLYVKPQTERDHEENNLAFFQTSQEDRGKVEELSTGVPPIIKKVARKKNCNSLGIHIFTPH